MNTKHTNRLLGAAHNGPATGHRWMRAPLLAPEGDLAPGSASPADPPAETPPPAVSVKTFTQEEVNRIAAQAREEGRKAAARAQTPPAAAPPASPAPQPSPPAQTDDERVTMRGLKEQLEEMRRARESDQKRSAFEKAAARFEMSDDQIADYFDLFEKRGGADPKEFLVSKGFKPVSAQQPTQPTTATQAAPATPVTPPAAAPNAPTTPVSPTTTNGLVNIFGLKAEEIDQLGPSGMREHFEKALQIGRQMSGAPPRPKLPPPTR